MDTLKAEQIGSAKWRVLAIPFGGPFKGKDLDGEFFSPRTDIKPRWFRERPVLFHHGRDATIKDADLGVEEMDDEASKDGWWGTVWLDRSTRYWAQIDALMRTGKLFGSSGALSHLVRKDVKSGEILVWPHAEQTLSPIPVNFFSRLTASKALEAYDSAGIELDDTLKSLLEELDRRGDDLRPDLSTDGEPDLSVGGDDEARQRLVEQTNYLSGLLKSLR